MEETELTVAEDSKELGVRLKMGGSVADTETNKDDSNMNQNNNSYESTDSDDTNQSSNKYLSCALLIWEVTKSYVGKLCCCCLLSENTSSREFLWTLFKQNAHITISYFLMYFAFGMCVGFMGPTLEDMACFTMEDESKLSWALTAQTCFMVVGIFLCGFLSKCISGDFMLLLSLYFLPITLLIVSFSRHLYVLATVMAIMGIAMGTIDCLANLQLVQIYDKAVAPFLQAMHFCYGLGALISPLIAENFLINEDCSSMVRNVTAELTTLPSIEAMRMSNISNNVTAGTTNSSMEEKQLIEAHDSTRVNQAFWIMAAIQVPIVIYVTITMVIKGIRVRSVNANFKRLVNSESKPILQDLEGKERKKAEKGKLLTQWLEYLNEFQGSYSISFTKAALLTLAACAMVFIYDGLQGHVNVYTQTYAVKILKEPNAQKGVGFVNVFFWLAYSTGRLISIVMAVKFTPYFMLLTSVVGSQIAVFMFLSCVGGNSFLTLMGGNVVLGLSMSSVTPTTITMTEHFMDMTSLQMAMIIGGAALGEMVIPLIEGQLIDKNPSSFVMIMLVLVGFSWLVYAVFWLMGRVTQKYKAIASPSFIWYNPQQLDYNENSTTHKEESAVLDAHHYSNEEIASMCHDSTSETALNGEGNHQSPSTKAKSSYGGLEGH